LNAPLKKTSVAPFWMDETEITNGQYKQFIKWVCDSIIREKLADPEYGGNKEFKIAANRKSEGFEVSRLNWDIPIPSESQANDDEKKTLHYFRVKDEVRNAYHTNLSKILYRYEWYDYTAEAKLSKQLEEIKSLRHAASNAKGQQPVMITKDTAYITDAGKVVNATLTRPLSSSFDFLNTRIVAIYPDTTCWINDFPKSNNETYLLNYFPQPEYNSFPVVGVSWEQAVAFCHWRTNCSSAAVNLLGQKVMEYRLPTEAEWEYAARGKQKHWGFPWKGNLIGSERNDYYANFKPTKGGYANDGHIVTAKVASFPSNEYGLYDMLGNVAEWTSTTWDEYSYENMSDLNPDTQKNQVELGLYSLKRKVVRGGSWKDAARFVKPSSRRYEYLNGKRCFIGFRCVCTQIGETKTSK